MNTLLEQKSILRQNAEMGVSYLLEDSDYFQQIGFKMLQNHSVQNLLECIKIDFNGKIKLIYPAKGYRNLEQILPLLDENGYLSVAVNFLMLLQDIGENGILKCGHLDISESSVFVDWNTWNVYLIYLPIRDEYIAAKGAEFETIVRRNLELWASRTPAAAGQVIRDFVRRLGDRNYKLRDISQVYSSWGSAAV